MVNTYKQDEEKTKFSWHNIIRVLDFVKTYKKDLYIAVIIGIFANIMLLFIPKIVTYAVDVCFLDKNFEGIVVLTMLMLVIIIVSLSLTRIRRDKVSIILNKVSNDLKIAIFTKLQYLPNSYFDTRSHGKIYTRVATYPDEAAIILCYVLLEIIIDVINLIFVVVFMLISNVKLSLISIILAIILTTFFMFLAPVRRKFQHIVNNKNSNINAYISESINGIRITQSFNREKMNEDILHTLEKERIKATKKTMLIGNLNWSLTGILNYVSMAIIYYVGLKYMYPMVSLGVIVAIDSYSSRFWEPIEYLTSSYNDIMDASTYLERIFELLDEDLVIENSDKARKIQVKGNVELKDVKFSYVDKKLVLDNINIKIKAGEKVGLVGETGCGKSTILSLISRFYDVSDGEILIDGVNIKDIKLNSLR
ncbi:MAG: ABC transporter ATP-binding protein/permease [Bacilli bacterium]|nr:ABC transporter ATP-binding protein/permease [Bacilli bacterium]